MSAAQRALSSSASGVGLAIVIPVASSTRFFIGAALVQVPRRKKQTLAEAAVLPVGLGFIVGESLIRVGGTVARSSGVRPR